MSYTPEQATSSAPVDAAPSDSAPIDHTPPSSSLPSSHLLPLPYDPTTQTPLAGSADSPTYFWNASLPLEHIACSTPYRNVTSLCCPGEIGIWDSGEGGSSCRTTDSQENRDWIANCTHQLWIEHNPGHGAARKAAVRCWPMSDKKDEREKDRKEVLRVSSEGRLGCGTLGTWDGIHNFTGECCAVMGGEVGDVKEENGTWPQRCELGPDQEVAWQECVEGLGTYGTCTTAYRPPVLASGAERVGVGLAVVAAGLASLF